MSTYVPEKEKLLKGSVSTNNKEWDKTVSLKIGMGVALTKSPESETKPSDTMALNSPWQHHQQITAFQ